MDGFADSVTAVDAESVDNWMKEYEQRMATVTLANHLTALMIESVRLVGDLNGFDPKLETEAQALLTDVNGLTIDGISEQLQGLNERALRLQINLIRVTQVMEERRRNLADFSILVLGEKIAGAYGHARVNDIAQAFAASLRPADTDGHLDFDLIAGDMSADSPLIREASNHISALFVTWVTTRPAILRRTTSRSRKPWESITVGSAREEAQIRLRNPARPEDATEVRDWNPARNDHRLRKHHIVRALSREKGDLGQYESNKLVTEVIGDIDALLDIISNNLSGTYGLNTHYGKSQSTGRVWLETIYRKILWIQENVKKK